MRMKLALDQETDCGHFILGAIEVGANRLRGPWGLFQTTGHAVGHAITVPVAILENGFRVICYMALNAGMAPDT